MNKFIFYLACLCFINTVIFAKTLPYKHYLPRFESAHSVAFDTVIENGTLLSNSEEEKYYREEILTQLFYLVGALNAYQSTAELAHLKLNITSVSPANNEGYSKISYKASFIIGWAKGTKQYTQMDLPVPYQADEAGITGYFKNHKSSCSENPNESDLSPESFYYYYRPNKSSCKILSHPKQNKDAAIITLKMTPSLSSSTDKSPEYEKIWEDGTLVSTIIVGTDHPGGTENTDWGIKAYNDQIIAAQTAFGKVVWINPPLKEKELAGIARPDVEMEIELPDGRKMNLNFLLIDKYLLQTGSGEFERRYNERTRISDFVSYNGHSGFGENIRALAKMGNFVRNQYQLYYVNGCDTFAYVDDALASAHQMANPGSGLYRYFDIITNAMPSSFGYFLQTNFAILNGMVGTKLNYRDILMNFNAYQKAIVMGEEDNRWPNPF